MQTNKKSGATKQMGQDNRQSYHHQHLQRATTTEFRSNQGATTTTNTRRPGPQYHQRPQRNTYRPRNYGQTPLRDHSRPFHSNPANNRRQPQRNRPRPRQGHPCMSPLDQKLLDLRKTYKNNALSYINLQTQADFLSACILHKFTPKGFRIRIRCLTPKMERSNIETIFKEFLGEAEEGFTTMFRDHLHFVAAQVKDDINTTLTAIHDTTNIV